MNKCLDCGHVQNINHPVYKDKMGFYMICENCESSFDVDLGTVLKEIM